MEDETMHYGCGYLPSPAPLATPYVPFQQLNPPKYTAKKGMRRGTLFPGLDLPFMGMVNEDDGEDTPLLELQALCFALQELALYLDTHREDREAAELFSQYSDLYRQGMMTYQAEYGPISRDDAVVNGEYLWTKGPWPWENCANEEG